MFRNIDEYINKLYFYILFIGVNLTFFPIHQVGILGIPRRYFAYGEVFMNLNIVTFVRTLFTIIRWVVLIVILCDSIVKRLIGMGYIRVADSVYGNNLPQHTYMENVRISSM